MHRSMVRKVSLQQLHLHFARAGALLFGLLTLAWIMLIPPVPHQQVQGAGGFPDPFPTGTATA